MLTFRFNCGCVRRLTVVIVVLTTIALCGSCAPLTTTQQSAKYCAIMPDSVGLYVNNPVSQMGFEIGRITAVSPSSQSVRVDFTVEKQRPLPSNVKAVIRSTSILADRSLELVGNYTDGPKLSAGTCITLNRSLTPKSLSQVIGASTNFVNSISPEGSANIAGVLHGVDQALNNQGHNANRLLTTAASVLDSPGQAIGDLSSITTNLGTLTTTLANLEPTLKSVFSDVDSYAPEIVTVGQSSSVAWSGLAPILTMVADLETQLGPQIQQLLDTVSVAIRKLAPRAPFYASILNVAPRLINGMVNIVNTHQFGTLRYRPPLYRLRAPDGVLQCNLMNASVPGSCANVQGMPYAVDVALLQYVLTMASR
ncbi:MlaD family protein [Mycobacterium intracellulare]|uniref:Mce family protein n=1 Tax=Mycobacterium intracellulare subsp. chimaera TaxID=222805 RepID=A0A7U5MPZ9_MYCIT|nr:MlaD family protein [Mycobacterium intracellulare]ASL17543.1 Mce family protein [Mycobacterium intracellulare subsp. chimaera]MDM3929478.1 MlaD family protein [Mycobacterium intracellulare subsp. chimaera]